MAEAFREQIISHPVSGEQKTAFGITYSVTGSLRAPNGITPRVKSVWIILQAQAHPRLVTAYPVSQTHSE